VRSLTEVKDPELAHKLQRLGDLVQAKQDPKPKQKAALPQGEGRFDYCFRNDPDQMRDFALVAQQRGHDPED
jgi:hypothetical protein